MADAPTGLIYAFDENLGGLPAVLKQARFHSEASITTLRELGFQGSSDVAWIAALGAAGNYVVVTRDSAILSVAAQSAAWRTSGLRLVMLSRRWGQMRTPELARTLLCWWPNIIKYAHASTPGSACVVTHRVPEPPARGIRPVTGSAPPA